MSWRGEHEAADSAMPPGTWLRQQRMAAGLTQEDLAARSGVSVRAIADLERGKTRRPYPSSVRALAQALGVPDAVGAELIYRYRAGIGPPPAADDEAKVVPRQLTTTLSYFAGRDRELTLLDSLLGTGVSGGVTATAVISGMAGVGKTTLALHWAHRVAGKFPDGQLYANLRGFDMSARPADPADVLRGFLDALQVHPERIPSDVEALAALYRGVLSDRKILVFLDDASDTTQVRPLLPASPGCVVVVTSRRELPALAVREGARIFRLDVLTEEESTGLLTARLGTRRAAAEPAAVKDLARLCAQLPLALSVTVARAAAQPDRPLGALVAELGGTQGRLDALDAGDPAASVRSVFALSYRDLSDPAARMFRLLGLHPGPDITGAAAASLAGVPERQARAALRELAQASLITESVTGRFAFHDLLRAYALEEARLRESDEELRTASHRALDHYLHTARAAQRVLYPGRDLIALRRPLARVIAEDFSATDDALTWLQSEYQVNLKLIDLAAGQRLDSHAWRLAVVLWRFHFAYGHWHDCEVTHQIAVDAARRLGDREGQAHALWGLGWIYVWTGDHERAHERLFEARELFRELGDNVGLARTCTCIGLVFNNQGRFHEALSMTLEAVRLLEPGPDDENIRLERASALNTAAEIHVHLGEYPQARVRCQQALRLCREIGYSPGEAGTWDTLGYVCQHLGEHAEATTCFVRAAELSRETGNRFQLATALGHLGDTYQAMGDTGEARKVWAEALALFEDMHNLPAAREVRASLADLT
jgi:tetratricopeptide (TPR) repeat protein/transcriptional regulator with XRE-family HTH domain